VRTIIEPFRIKVVEPIRATTRSEREAALTRSHHNIFGLRAEEVLIDFLTDSGTGAMSQEQWAAVMRGDESYAGGRSYFRFKEAVSEIFGYDQVLPVHQGRAAERILFGLVGGEGKVVPNNTHFDTTRANVEASGARAADLPCEQARDPSSDYPFKGNMDVAGLERLLDEVGVENVPLVMLTVTNNAGGGQPVSMENARAVAEVCKARGLPLFFDACRFAENAYFIQRREPGFSDVSVKEIAQRMFALGDGATMSAKKDGHANIGGFLTLNDDALAAEMRNVLILTEGFPTYGGLAGRDLEAIAQGLKEVVDEDYLRYRIASTAYLCDHLHEAGVPVVRPAGGHAVYLDAGRFVPHVPRELFPGQAVVCELYLHGGIRGCEMGSVMFPSHDRELKAKAKAQHPGPRMELVRLAIPRRMYTQSHVDYAVEAIIEVFETREELPGYKITWEPPRLRHFTCRFEPVPV